MTKFLQNNNSKFQQEFAGYANIFHNIDQDNDIILPGAFDYGQDPPLPLLWQHNHQQPIGKITEYTSDAVGLRVHGYIMLNLLQGDEAVSLIANGIINALSIGFQVLDYFYEDNSRFITALRLREISLVTFPANEKTSVYLVNDYRQLDAALSKSQNKLTSNLNGG